MEFTVDTSHKVDEIYPVGIKAFEVPRYLAERKADAFPIIDGEVIISADTVVILGDEILGKPKDRDKAVEMLEKLSGQTHTVVTAVCLRTVSGKEVFSSATKVTFRELSQKEIEYYVDNYKPYDKAGSYAIQEWIGHVGIERIEGSYNNVVGLPTEKLYVKLQTL